MRVAPESIDSKTILCTSFLAETETSGPKSTSPCGSPTIFFSNRSTIFFINILMFFLVTINLFADIQLWPVFNNLPSIQALTASPTCASSRMIISFPSMDSN